MKVYYIGGNYEGCYYVRCLLPQIHNGWDGDRVNLTQEPKLNDEVFREAMQSDIIVFHRPIQTEKVEAMKLLKTYGKKIVMDNDDTYLPNSGLPTIMKKGFEDNMDLLEEYSNNLTKAAEIADLVTVATPFLKEEYSKYNDNVVILPNQVDPFEYPLILKNNGKKKRVGLIGSVAATGDYKQIEDALGYLKGRGDVEIVVFGLPPKGTKEHEKMREIYKAELAFWDEYADFRQPYVRMRDYFETLNDLRLDLMLIPRDESYFNKCKSNIKYLEASMLEIPVIAQSFTDGNSPYDKDIMNSENGYLVKTGDSWIPTLEKMLDNDSLRKQIAKRAKEYTLKNYNIETNYLNWQKAYQTI